MVEIKKLNVSYKKKVVLEDINLELKDKGLYFLLGKNGTGKTTFIKAVSSLINFEGNVLFDGQIINNIRQEIFVIFDDIPLYLNLTGKQNIELFSNSNTKYLIKELNLLDEDKLQKKVGTYSLGEKQKLYLLIACLKKPKYLFIDELTNGLDHDTLKIVKEILVELSKNSLVVVSGHNLHFYQDLTEYLLLLKSKNIILIEDFMQNGGDLFYEYEKHFSNI